MDAFVGVFGFWPTAILLLVACLIGRSGGKFLLSVGTGFTAGSIAIGLYFASKPDGWPALAITAWGIVFGVVLLLSRLYYSGVLGRLLTPKK